MPAIASSLTGPAAFWFDVARRWMRFRAEIPTGSGLFAIFQPSIRAICGVIVLETDFSLYEHVWGERPPSQGNRAAPGTQFKEGSVGGEPASAVAGPDAPVETRLTMLGEIVDRLEKQEERIMDRVEQLERRLRKRDAALAEILSTLTGLDP